MKTKPGNNEKKIEKILAALLKYTKSNFPQKRIRGDKHDGLDAIMAIVNRFGEKFDSQISQLKESEERFFKTFDFNPVGMIVTDLATTRFQYVNEIFLSSSGYTRKEVIGKTSLELNLIEPEFREKILSRLKQEGDVKDIEILVRKKNGETFWSLTSVKTLIINNKKFVLNSFHDITEQKNTEKQIRLYTEIVKKIPIGIDIMQFENLEDTRTLKIIYINPAFEKMARVQSETMIGKYVIDASPETFKNGRDKMYQELVRSGKSKDLGLVHYSGNDIIPENYFHFLVFTLPGNFVIIAVENVTERVKAEKVFYVGLDSSADYDIYIKEKSRLVKINTSDIIYIEAMDDYVIIYTGSQKFIVHTTMKEMEAKLPSAFFFRVHHSFIVRLDKIAEVQDTTLLVNKKLIPVSRSNKPQLMNRLKVI